MGDTGILLLIYLTIFSGAVCFENIFEVIGAILLLADLELGHGIMSLIIFLHLLDLAWMDLVLAAETFVF